MGVSQQEVVQTEESVFTTKAEANIQYIKSELEALTDGGGLQEITLDPIQIALGESVVSESQDIQVMDQESGLSSQDDALKLLASHGITMLGDQETPVTPNSLSLTEAGKLALFSTSTSNNFSASNNQIVSEGLSLASRTPLGSASRTQILNTSPLSTARPSVQTISKPITKVVTLNSKPVAPPATSGNNKASRVIKLTPAQFAAIKKGKAGQIVLPALSSQGKRETITLRNPSLPAVSNVVTRNPSLSFASSVGSKSPGIALASPVPRKVIRLENPSSASTTSVGDKSELARRLQRELEEKEREKDRYRREMHKREEEADRIKAQLKALSS